MSETYLDGLGIESQALLLVGEEILNILALIALELDNLTHGVVGYDCSIAGKLLLDNLQDLLLIKLLGKSLNCSQGLTTITFCS